MRLLTLLVGMVSVAVAVGSDRVALIEQALDQPTQFHVKDALVVEAFESLASATGVDANISDEVLDLLPYGAATQVTVDIEGATLREGMTAFLRSLGLTFTVGEDGVRVLPLPELQRITRRATWAELDQLDFVRNLDWTSVSDPDALRQRFQIRGPEGSWNRIVNGAANIGAGAGDEVLTLICNKLGLTWFPEDDKIVVLPGADQIRRQLGCPISLRITHRPLIDVLQELGRRAHVTIGYEPGVLASLPTQTRQNFSLLVDGTTGLESLEQIAAATGLGFRVDTDAIVFYHPGSRIPDPADDTASKPPARDPFVAKLIVPAAPGEVQVEILIRASELSAEALESRGKLIRKADEILRMELERSADEPASE